MLLRMRGCEGKVRGKDKKIGYGDDIAYKPSRKHKCTGKKVGYRDNLPEQIDVNQYNELLDISQKSFHPKV